MPEARTIPTDEEAFEALERVRGALCPRTSKCFNCGRAHEALDRLAEYLAAARSSPGEEGVQRLLVANIEQALGEYVRDYEFRGEDGDYVPNETERALIEDALAGWEAEREDVVRETLLALYTRQETADD